MPGAGENRQEVDICFEEREGRWRERELEGGRRERERDRDRERQRQRESNRETDKLTLLSKLGFNKITNLCVV